MKRFAFIVAALIVAGCSKAPEPTPKPAPEPVVSKATPSAATLEKFARADLLDGKEDKIITSCPSWGLAMKGKESFSCKVGDYTLYSWAAKCNDRVAADPDKVFSNIEVPKKK